MLQDHSYLTTTLMILTALGIREIIVVIATRISTKEKTSSEIEKTDAETEGKHLENAKSYIELIQEYQEKFKMQAQLITELREESYQDKVKIEQRDAVVKYQREEIKELHTELTNLKAELSALEVQVKELADSNDRLVKENLQMRAILHSLNPDLNDET